MDFAKKKILVETSVTDPSVTHALTSDRHEGKSKEEVQETRAENARKGQMFELAYDKLVIAVGCYSQTFNTPGVKENALFLKDIGDARKIRKRILECFELASLPTTSEKWKKSLLHFAIVGGGPTGMEFSAQLTDLAHQDLADLYPKLKPYFKVTVYDVAPTILSMFDESLAKYAMETFKRDGVEFKTSHHVELLRTGFPGQSEEEYKKHPRGGCMTIKTKEDGEVGIGACVWSTGNMMNPFVQNALDKVYAYPEASAQSLSEAKPSPELQWIIKRHPKTGAMMCDDRLHLQLHTSVKEGEEPSGRAYMKDVFAIGDNMMLESGPLPATAQVANQEAIWLAKRLNKGDLEKHTFGFNNLGVMTYVSGAKGLLQPGEGGHTNIKGMTAYLIWKGAYLTKSVSWRNRLLIPVFWAVHWMFGRDISRS